MFGINIKIILFIDKKIKTTYNFYYGYNSVHNSNIYSSHSS